MKKIFFVIYLLKPCENINFRVWMPFVRFRKNFHPCLVLYRQIVYFIDYMASPFDWTTVIEHRDLTAAGNLLIYRQYSAHTYARRKKPLLRIILLFFHKRFRYKCFPPSNYRRQYLKSYSLFTCGVSSV